MEMKLYQCEICGKIVAIIKDSPADLVCCGMEMTQIIPGTSDGAVEKHVPVVQIDGNKVTVTVGCVEHPMLEKHYIEWISIETSEGRQRKVLQPGNQPKAVFLLAENEQFVSANAYCNLHGLWEA